MSAVQLPPTGPCHLRRGSTVLMTVIFLALFASLAVAFVAGGDLNLQQAGNYGRAQRAHLAAESGLNYMIAQLGTVYLPASVTREQLLQRVHQKLANQMNGTLNLSGQTVTFTGSTIQVPPITLDAARDTRFRAEVVDPGTGDLVLVVQGTTGRITKTLSMHLEMVPGTSAALDYGLASKGKVILNGSATLGAANDPAEANVLGASAVCLEAVAVGGSAVIDGDIWTTEPGSYVAVTGNPTVGGATGEAIADHIHCESGDVQFPEVDASQFAQYATTILTDASKIPKGAVLDNVIIPAGTNPTFANDVVLRGVVYIQQPNSVKFTAKCDVIGVIVTDDATGNTWANNLISFTGTSTTHGVEALPDLPQFRALRQMPGTAIMAPGFTVDFGGDFGAMNGAIIADEFVFRGNVHGTVYGPMICYGDTEFTVTGNTTLTIDRSRYGRIPPGFIQPTHLRPVAETYQEQP